MSGETGDSMSGWTVDTLLAHMEQVRREQLEAAAKLREESILRNDARFAALHDIITAHEEAQAKLRDESNLRYEQRYEGQELAVRLALATVDKEFHEHLQSVRTETGSALAAADKAILKSEMSTEKRFESVNEFRQTLTDQATTFIPRREAEQQIGGMAEKIESLDRRMSESLATINSRLDRTSGADLGAKLDTIERRLSEQPGGIVSRLDRSEGRDTGVSAAWGYLVGAIGAAGGFIGIVIAITR